MASWDVKYRVNVSGVGERTVERTVEAETAEAAIESAKRDLVLVSLISVRPTPQA